MNFFKQNKKQIPVILTVFIFSALFLFYGLKYAAAAAGVWDAVKVGVAGLLIYVINIARAIALDIMLWMLKGIVALGQYNNFIYNPFVDNGWVVLRDLVNMFFILGLLFIAFVTVLKIEKYQWNKFLGRLLIMAILVNFSKTICGVIIDFFQVIMLTFVNSFKDVAEGNIFKGLGLVEAITGTVPADSQFQNESGFMAVVGSLLGLIYLLVAMLVIGVFALVLAFRIVALWVLVVFSPLAFFAYVFEGVAGKVGSLANRWWDQFLNYCMVGPILAFFLWLSIVTMSSGEAYVDPDSLQSISDKCIGALCEGSTTIKFLFGIAMLVIGLYAAAETGTAMSGKGAQWVNSAKNWGNNKLDSSVRWAGSKAYGAAMYAPRGIARRGYRAVSSYTGGAWEGIKSGLAENITQGKGVVGKTFVGRAWKATAGEFLRATTEKGADQKKREMKARFQGWLGPKGQVREDVDKEVVEEQKKDIKQEKGIMESSKNWRQELEKAEKTGDYRRHRALLEIGMEQGFGKKGDVDKFFDKFSKGPLKKYSGKDDMSWIRFTEGLEKTYEDKTGTAMPLNEYYIDEEGQVQDRKEYTMAEEIKEKSADLDAAGFIKRGNNKNLGNIFEAGGKEDQKIQLLNLFGLAANHGYTGKLTEERRSRIQSTINKVMGDENGQKLIQEMIDAGDIDEKDLENLDIFNWKLGAEYKSTQTGELAEGYETEKERKQQGTADTETSNKIQSFKGHTKTAMGNNIAMAGAVQDVDKLKTGTVKDIKDSIDDPIFDDTRVPVMTGAATPDEIAKQDAYNEKMKAKQEQAKKDKLDIKIAVEINEELKNVKDPTNEAEIRTAIEKGITAAGATASQDEIDKQFRKYKKAGFTESSIKKEAVKFKATYGKLSDRGKSVAETVKSDKFDDSIDDFETAINTGDLGNIEANGEEAILAGQTILNKIDNIGKQYNMETNADFKAIKKKLETAAKRFRAERDKTKKTDIAREIKGLLTDIQTQAYKDDTQDNYFSGDWKADEIKKRLESLAAVPQPFAEKELYKTLKFRKDFMDEVKKLMKGKAYTTAAVQKAVKDARTNLGI